MENSGGRFKLLAFGVNILISFQASNSLSLSFNELVTSLLLAALVYLSIASYWLVLSTALFPHILLHTLSLNILSPAKHFMRLLQLINFWWTFKAFQYGHVRTWYWNLRVHAVPKHSSLLLLSPLNISPLLRIPKFSFLFGWDSLFPKATTPLFLPQKLPVSSCVFPYQTKMVINISIDHQKCTPSP